MQRALVLFASLLVLGGCSLIPSYNTPEPAIPAEWPDGPAYLNSEKDTAQDQEISDIGWRDFFVDPNLRQLITLALENNQDARLVALEVERAHARYAIQRTQLLPQVNGQAGYTRQKFPENFSGGSSNDVSNQETSGGGGEFEFYRVGVGLTQYELDLFGKVRSLKSQALQTYLASEQARRSAQISLISEVANTYLNLLADREQLVIAEKNLDAQMEGLRLVDRRYQVGYSPYFDLLRMRILVESARAEVALFRRRVAQDRNALMALSGAPIADEKLAGRKVAAPIMVSLPSVGLHSRLLLRRPDVLAAEHRLKAANANIGAARAAFFPSISLVGSYGTISSDLGGLFTADSTGWSFSPQLSLPLFDGGRNQANLDVAQVSKKVEVAEYQRTVQVAFRETADVLAGRGTLGEEVDARRELLKAANQSYDIAYKRYFQGIESFSTVIESYATLFDGQQELIDAQLAQQSNIVNLYKALGGGWREQTAVAPQNADVAAQN